MKTPPMLSEATTQDFIETMKGLRSLTREACGEKGLSMNLWVTLVSLAGCGPMTMSQISHKLDLSHSTSTGLVDRLVAMGLIERVQDAEDRRVVRVSLTDAGSTLVLDIKELVRLKLNAALAALDHDAHRRLADGLGLLADVFRSLSLTSNEVHHDSARQRS